MTSPEIVNEVINVVVSAAAADVAVAPAVVDVVTVSDGGVGISLPDQAGQDGKLLTTDGDSPAWVTPSVVYVSVTTGNEARPDAYLVVWIGDAEPVNATDNDLWIFSGVAPVITTDAIPELVTVGELFTLDLAATGTGPLTWWVANGTLPQGLALSVDGQLSGTPEIAGPYDFTVGAVNAEGADFQQYTGNVMSGLPQILTVTLDAMSLGVPFTQTLEADTVDPVSWTLVEGSIPGLTLSAGGVLSGTPTDVGPYSIIVAVDFV